MVAIGYLIKHEIFDNMNILRYIQDILEIFIWSICAAMTAYLPSFDSLYSSAKGNPMKIFSKQEGHQVKICAKSQISRPCKGNGKPSKNAGRCEGDWNVSHFQHILTNLAFAYSLKARAVAFLVWRRKMEQDLGNRLVSDSYMFMFWYLAMVVPRVAGGDQQGL